MTNQRKIELYTIVLNNLYTPLNKNKGICLIIADMGYFGEENLKKEILILEKDFISRKPGIFSKFFWKRPYHKASDKGAYWWPLNEKGNEARKEFITHIINKLKSE